MIIATDSSTISEHK